MTHPPLDDRAAEALLAGRVVAQHADLRAAVDLIRAAVPASPPVPSAALASVLETGLEPPPVPAVPSVGSAGRRPRWAVRIGVAAAAALCTTLTAATANALPAPVQSAVAQAVGALTSFDLPRPGESARADDRTTPPASVPPGEPPVARPGRSSTDQQSGADDVEPAVPDREPVPAAPPSSGGAAVGDPEPLSRDDRTDGPRSGDGSGVDDAAAEADTVDEPDDRGDPDDRPDVDVSDDAEIDVPDRSQPAEPDASDEPREPGQPEQSVDRPDEVDDGATPTDADDAGGITGSEDRAGADAAETLDD